MAKLSAINKNNKRIKLSDKYYKRRETLKKTIMNKKLSFEERLTKLLSMPRWFFSSNDIIEPPQRELSFAMKTSLSMAVIISFVFFGCGFSNIVALLE